MKDGTSRHLQLLADHVESGAHVVLRGHLGDAVLVDEEVKEELWAIGHLLAENAGMESVLAANRADGLHRLGGSDEEEVAGLLGRLRGPDEEDVAFGPTTGPGIARSVRLLLRQQEMSVAIVLRDAATLIGGEAEQSRETLSILVEAMAQAELAGRSSRPVQPRNTLILYGTPTSPAVDQLAAIPGVVEQDVEPPDRSEREATLRYIATGFYGAAEERPGEGDLKSLARVTHGYSLSGLEQLRRRSHAVCIPASRPESLYRAARGERTSTPIERVGVDEIVGMLEEEIIGQPQAIAKIHTLLERGRWRSANRPPGATVTRPMATLVLHGPSGVGKTETGLILAEAVLGSRDAVRRIDCAEFQADHDTARLTGAPPGYIGYEDGGVLSDALQESATVIVLDEFDRGPPRLAEMLLGILDAGRLTDGRGRTATFENAILILTTNAGSDEIDQSKSGLDQAPGTDEVLGRSATRLEELVKTRRARQDPDLPPGEPVRSEGLGSNALWSRIQDSLVGYDILRREAFDRIVERACTHLGENLGDEYGIRPAFAADRFAARLFERMPDRWDGRSIFPRVQEFLEVPAREVLEAKRDTLPAGTELPFVPDEAGRAQWQGALPAAQV
jgi:DNA polymerase III delta prime subunit